ncbi:MAG: hypothetical protein GF341_07495 [candidate division Zixibacteria bacterium]|nr:hypothetical protein [candidate division Zixibacteria bacterium]
MNANAKRLATLMAVALLISTVPAVAATPGEQAVPERLGPVNPLPGVTLADLSERAALNSTMSLTADGMRLAQATDEVPDFGGDVYGYEPKSSRRAFLQSLVVPGWGQWYYGSRWKPFVFLGLEAAGWYFWSDFRSTGSDLEDQYQVFADGTDPQSGVVRWGFDRYIDGLQEVYEIDDDRQAWRNPDTGDSTFFSHHISEDDAEEKNDTYYENIGKYDQFAFGWHDFNPNDKDFGPGDTTYSDGTPIVFVTEDRQNYVQQRDAANREFNKASTVLILTIGNHLLSAFEAALGAKRYNRSRDQFGQIDADLRLTRTNLSTELAPRFTLRYLF